MTNGSLVPVSPRQIIPVVRSIEIFPDSLNRVTLRTSACSRGTQLNAPVQSQDQPDVHRRQFSAPYKVTDHALSEPARYIARTPFELEEQQFELLKSPHAGSLIVGGFAGVVLSFLLTVLAKELAHRYFGKDGPEPWEYTALIVSGLITLIAHCISFYWTTKRTELVKLIHQFYKANPPRRIYADNPWKGP